MRVLLCGGGTAGHVTPAIAISEIIERRFKNVSIAFAGRIDGEENKAYLRTGHPLYTIDISGFSRSISVKNIKSLIKVLKSSRKAKKIINDFEPDLIIGTGGYVCFPFIRQGQKMNIKTVMHESNVYPGLVTRLLGKNCNAVMLSSEGTKDYLKSIKNTVTVGNPVRQDFASIGKNEARKKLNIKPQELLIVSFGGSLGSPALNTCIGTIIRDHTSKMNNIVHIHATGSSNYDKMKAEYPSLFKNNRNVIITPYIEDMPTVLSAADIAITRSGAMTMSELARSETPAILIPSPNVVSNHQLKNAEYMKTLGAAELIEEKNLSPEVLTELILDIISSSAKMNKMISALRKLSHKNTEEMVYKSLKETMRYKQC